MIRKTCLALFCAACLVTVSLFGLQKPESKKDEQKGGPARFKAEVDQVVLYATVYNQLGKAVSGLTKDDFQVYEDRVLQSVDYFAVGDVPSTIGLVLDISGSMKPRMATVEEAVDLFLNAEQEDNELFLVAFNSEASLEEPFTHDVEDIRDAVHNLIPSGGTALNDAVYLAVGQATQGSEPRKTVIVFTDGEDKDSYYSHEELIEHIQEQDVQVYVVAFLDEDLSDDGGFFGVFKSQREKVTQEMTKVADATGGKAFFPGKPEELVGAFKTISEELRNQYQFAYTSTNPVLDGSWRSIRLTVESPQEKAYKVRVKKGYFARK